MSPTIQNLGSIIDSAIIASNPSELWPRPRYYNPRPVCEKRPYSKREAQEARNARLRSRYGRPDDLRVYHCERCNHWHLTSKEER